MDNLENYVELLYEGKDKVRAREKRFRCYKKNSFKSW